MFTLKHSIENISPDYYSNNNSIFYQDEGILKVVSPNLIEEVDITESKKFALSVINHHTLIRTKDSVQLLNDQFKKEKEYLFSQSTSRQLLDISGQLKLLVNEAEEDYRVIRLYDGLMSKTVFEQYDHDLARIVEEDYLLLLRKSTLTLISMLSGSVIWEFDLVDYSFNESSKVAKLELNNEFLFLYAHDSNWNNYGFRIVNVIDGKSVFSSNSFGPDFYVNEGVVYSVDRSKQVLQIINTNTFDIEKVDLSDELGEFVFETQCAPFFYENELYVALMERGEDVYSTWGVIDLNSFKLKFKMGMLRDFSTNSTRENKTFVSSIKASKNIVGIKVPGPTLHVFEKKKD